MLSGRLFWWIFAAFVFSVGFSILPVLILGWPAIRTNSFATICSVSVAFLVVAGTLSWLCARQVALPLERIRRIAERFSRGELSARLYPSRVREIESVAHSLNGMASNLEFQIDKLTLQRNELEIVLASMLEGVIAIDRNEHVFRINDAARRLLDIQTPDAVGRTLHEVVRSASLHEFVRRALGRSDFSSCELILPGSPERTIELSASELRMADGTPSGVLLVFHDLTNLRHLERIRRDFVANVSHELRTPITSIKGFVETLLDGAMHEPADRERFLKIIANHVDRLDAIFDNLLTLARVELHEESAQVEFLRRPLLDCLVAAQNYCLEKAEEKNISVSIECAADLHASINVGLLEQAITNLLDNAIKYTPPGGHVRMQASKKNERVSISVIDNGVGLEARHHDRIFERFYRVDEARTRKLGGTGLGLAIVKHIASVHGGTASVKSRIGEGSTFMIEFFDE